MTLNTTDKVATVLEIENTLLSSTAVTIGLRQEGYLEF